MTQTMPPKGAECQQQAGFAIVVVLASLLVLTTIFAIASQRSLAHMQTQNAERNLIKRQIEDTEVLALLRDMKRDGLITENVILPEPFSTITLRLQDAGGLVDLNTASPELLARLFAAMGMPDDALRRFRTWRQSGRRLQRVDDLIRITGADKATLGLLHINTTVHSGRRGIAPNHAPDLVREIAALEDETAPSSTNFVVYRASSENDVLIGVINLGTTRDQSRVLDVR